jgi:hypothetical protein
MHFLKHKPNRLTKSYKKNKNKNTSPPRLSLSRSSGGGLPHIPEDFSGDVETLRALRAMARFQVRVAQDKLDDLKEQVASLERLDRKLGGLDGDRIGAGHGVAHRAPRDYSPLPRDRRDYSPPRYGGRDFSPPRGRPVSPYGARW